MTAYVAAIDQGTTSSRCILFDQAGQIVASAQKEHRQIFPQPGWVEHDAAEIWINVQAVIKDAMARAGLNIDMVWSDWATVVGRGRVLEGTLTAPAEMVWATVHYRTIAYPEKYF